MVVTKSFALLLLFVGKLEISEDNNGLTKSGESGRGVEGNEATTPLPLSSSKFNREGGETDVEDRYNMEIPFQ